VVTGKTPDTVLLGFLSGAFLFFTGKFSGVNGYIRSEYFLLCTEQQIILVKNASSLSTDLSFI